METRKKQTKLWVCLLALGLMLVYSLLGSAGSLEPSGPPGPTMKTLDEVEARIPIPGSSSPAMPFVISSAGSYYLTGDRYSSEDGIRIDADNVTIDLNGYSLIGNGSSSFSGVYMRVRSNVEIRNGTIRNFNRGIYESDTSGKNHRIISVRSLSNNVDGIHLKGINHLVKDCIISNNGASSASDVYGIYVGIGSTVTGNTANSNGTSATGSEICGIYAGAGSTVTGNTAYKNGTSAIYDVYGIYADTGSTVSGNTCYENYKRGILANSSTIISNTCYNNGNDGIYANDGCTVIGNTCRDNGDDGIRATTGCTVTGNTSYSNDDKGINATYYCLIDQNTAYNNTGGNLYAGTGCVLGTNCAP